MYKIGVTGSIGSGKTTIAKIFALFRIPVFDADKTIKKILDREDVKKKLKKIWPIVIKRDGIDKLKLRKIIFSNLSEKNKLQKLLYPFLEKEKIKFEKKNHKKEILVYDVPLIYETKSENNYDLIIVAFCKESLQRKRVINRDKISIDLFNKIINTQLSFEEKKKYNPKVINTSYLKLFIFFEIFLLLISVLIKEKANRWAMKEN